MTFEFIAKRIRHKISTSGLVSGIIQILEVPARSVYRRLISQPILRSYSQAGEDKVIDRLLSEKTSGFYIDIGAFDPIHLSNTYRFYRKGWNGITIEPNPSKSSSFRKIRPRDTHLEVGLSDSAQTLNYHHFKPEYLSTFSEEKAKELTENGFKEEVIQVPVISCQFLKEKYLEGQQVDFLSIDVEGMDLKILSMLNLKYFRPKCICVEVGAYLEEYDEFFMTYEYERMYLSIHCGNTLNGIYMACSSS